jgi:hypothetical protein
VASSGAGPMQLNAGGGKAACSKRRSCLQIRGGAPGRHELAGEGRQGIDGPTAIGGPSRACAPLDIWLIRSAHSSQRF